MEESVFNRKISSGAIIGDSLYNLNIGLILCWGFFINWCMVTIISVDSLEDLNRWLVYIGYLSCCLLGSFLFKNSAHPFVSFISYNIVVVPLGLTLNLAINDFSTSHLVTDTITSVGFVTFMMMCLSTVFPRLFTHKFLTLLIAIALLLVVTAVECVMLNIQHQSFNLLVALIFSGYIGFDWGRANRVSKTVSNSVDSATSVYMDIVAIGCLVFRPFRRKKSRCSRRSID